MSLLDLLGVVQVLWNGSPVNPTRKRINIIGGAVADNEALDATDVTLPEGGGGEGTVIGPGTSVVGHVATFGTTDGTEIDDSGVAIADLATTAATAAAISGAITTALEGRDLGTDGAKLDGIEAGAQVTSAARVLTALAAAAGDISVNSHKITSLADPSGAQDADTKAARDAAIAAANFGAWTTLIESNLTAESNLSFANGDQSWLGYTWTGLNISGNVDSFGVVNGTGVVLDANAVSVDWYLTANTAPRLYLKASQIPNFQLGRTKLRLWMQLTGTGIDANFEAAKFGFETIPYASNARRFWYWALGQSGNMTPSTFDNNAEVGGGTPANAGTARVGMVELDTRNLEVQFWSKVPSASAGDPNSSEFTRASMLLCSTWRPAVGALTSLDATRTFAAANGDNLCLVFGMQTVNTSNTAVATWKRLRIEYINPP